MTTPIDNIEAEERVYNSDHVDKFVGPIGRIRNPDGTLVDEIPPEVEEHLEAVSEGWRTLYLTGDRTPLVELGILLPKRDERQGSN